MRLEKNPPLCERAEILMNDGAPCGEITQRLMKRRDVEACRQERLSGTSLTPHLRSAPLNQKTLESIYIFSYVVTVVKTLWKKCLE